MHKNDFLPFIFFSYHSFSLSYLELQIIFPCRDIGPATATLDMRPRHWTRDRDFGPATATLDPRPRHWTRDRDFGPATRDPRLLVKLISTTCIPRVTQIGPSLCFGWIFLVLFYSHREMCRYLMTFGLMLLLSVRSIWGG